MRGRASLGIKIPVITTSICADKDVLDAVGEDAMGWVFAGASEDKDTPERAIMRGILQPIMNVPAEEITAASLGLGGLGYLQIMSLVDYAKQEEALRGLQVRIQRCSSDFCSGCLHLVGVIHQ